MRLALRVMCLVLGILVRCEGKNEVQSKTVPIVSNHVTLFDHLVLCLTRECSTPHNHVFHWYSTFLDPENVSLSEFVAQSAQKAVKPWHVLLQQIPTGSSNDLSNFDSNLFEFLDKVQPVALVVNRPFPVCLVSHPINWVSEFIYQLFVPLTIYRVLYLEPICRQTNEVTSDYAERIRLAIAAACDQRQTTSSSYEDNEVKSPTTQSVINQPSASSQPGKDGDGVCSMRLRTRISGNKDKQISSHDTVITESSTADSTNGPFDHLIPVVKEVLGHLSDSQIRRSLFSSPSFPIDQVQTEGDVDATIDVLLTIGSESPSSCDDDDVDGRPLVNQHPIPASRLNTSVDTFASTSKARQQSLLERRQKLLDHARGSFTATTKSD